MESAGTASTHRRDRGATAVEYGLIVVLVAGLIIAIVASLGGKVSDNFNTAAEGGEFVEEEAEPTYTTCGSEGAICALTGTNTVRYGANDSWNTLTLTGSFTCDNATFGDPLVGTAKSCEVVS